MRPWRETDVDAVFAAQTADPASRLWAGGGALDTREDAVALVERLRIQPGRASWAVVDGGTGDLLGSVTVHSIDLRQGNARIGYRTTGAPGTAPGS
ncbi:GNAT family N-acetyltransferase [Blastococcus sp. VKM Ac-2987]|uniref:GNAT family N-acetyltransferase n=1 Tax=Blastococcus sp. VKM Ac-2987 TaxID=3004141 RepID=UPI0022AB6D00|nr:GNAT family N-acetyltransferase [Blastococcus sp. VKM Ac-2987]MCZ2858736.1 GNAT family N-acetyltransferase [Blastococcus sp. VKM Ac-2987]